MAGTFKFELVSPEKVLVSGDASEVQVPGMDGDFTVLAGHAPVLSTLRPGVLDIKLGSGPRRVFVRGGIAEVEPDRLTILAQHLLDLDGLDRATLDSELKAAETMLGAAKDDVQRLVAQSAIEQLKALAAKAA